MRSISGRALSAPRGLSFPRALRALRRTATLAGAAASAVALATACGQATANSGLAGAHASAASKAAQRATPTSPSSTSTASASTAPTSTASTSPAQLPGQPSCDPRQLDPIAASFVSASDGYLLAVTLSSCTAGTASKIAVRKTTDGGLHWTALPAPDAAWGGVAPDGSGHIPADGVTSVLFADERDGWAYGPGLWATHDGGATWHQVGTGGRAVKDMAASGGQVLASLESCDPYDSACDTPHTVAVETTPADRDAWQEVPGAAAGTEVTAQAGTGYAVTSGGPEETDVPMLTGPVDGSARWVSRPLPCKPGAIALTAVTTTRLLLACALLGEHPAPTYLYSSSDAGAHWTRFAVLGLFDGAAAIEQTPDGTVLVEGIYDGVELSRDGGRTWTRPATVDGSGPVQGGGPLGADLVTSEDGYVIGWLGPLWITRDAGRTWTQVPVR